MSEFEIGRGGYRTTPLGDVGMFTAEPSLVERRLIEVVLCVPMLSLSA